MIYAADPGPVNADGYYQEFDGADTAMYSIFNYYSDSNFQWERCNNAGYYDQHCIRFRNYDPRTQSTPENLGNSPDRGYSDFYTRAFDLSNGQFNNRASCSRCSEGHLEHGITRHLQWQSESIDITARRRLPPTSDYGAASWLP